MSELSIAVCRVSSGVSHKVIFWRRWNL